MSENTDRTKIKVIAVGGAGINAVNHMINTGLSGLEFIAIDFDTSSLEKTAAPVKIELESLYPPLTFPEFGNPARLRDRNSAIANREKIRSMIGSPDCIMIIAGIGGGTGSGVAPIVADTARETGALTIGVVTKPFGFEGQGRTRVAMAAIKDLAIRVDTLIVIPNDGILKTLRKRSTGVTEVFHLSDINLWRAVQCIFKCITTGCFPVDYPCYNESVGDMFKTKGGNTLSGRLGTGWASGKNRAKEATLMAIKSPLLEEPFNMAGSIIANFVCAPQLTLSEINDAAKIIVASSRPDAKILYDCMIDKNPKEDLYVTVVCLYEQNELMVAV